MTSSYIESVVDELIAMARTGILENAQDAHDAIAYVEAHADEFDGSLRVREAADMALELTAI